ncbi:MAG: cytochrome b/b6 domain-containing protein [Rhodospirillaceae bacterium]|nr:cytochrome b/b6 domain-containing protein [Rhodospirillaceae bacterium]
MSSDRIIRHKLIDRLFHWAMAASMLTLLGTGLCPILGLEFDWVPVHWISGVVLTVTVVWHVIRSIVRKNLLSIWVGPGELLNALATVRSGLLPKPGKYSIAQRLMHSSVTVFCLTALVTGLLMLVRIDTPFWERDPYLLSQSIWGWIYVLHGLAALVFVSLIILHVYFGVRPEKLFYLRSMVFGWISREEMEGNHDPALWTDTGDKSS